MKRIICFLFIGCLATSIFSQNFGIDQPNPTQKLDVNGSIAIAKGASIAPAAFGHNPGNDNTITFGQDGGSFGGIGVVNYFDGSYNNQYITFATHHGGVTAGERMRIDRDGNVGIGTTNPVQKLDVNGNIKSSALAGTGLRPVYTDANGVLVTGGIAATGGNTVTDIAGYRVHYFIGSGTFSVTTGGNVEVLMVGGGGSGGGRHGGGGGGGGVIYMPSVAVASGTNYNIVVGAGAPVNTGCTNVQGANGGNTTAFNETALGGGGGGTYAVTYGLAGGSGGGAGHSGYVSEVGGAATQGNPTSHVGTGYGNAGANNPNAGNEAAGGGGAGGPGQRPVPELYGGNGGPGVLINIDGTNRYWGGGGGGGGWGNFAGAGGIGGGGGGCAAGGGNAGPGGGSALNSGQTGATVPGGGPANGGDGGANTGGGGGGSGQCGYQSWPTGNGGAGGSGIVVIRYLH